MRRRCLSIVAVPLVASLAALAGLRASSIGVFFREASESSTAAYAYDGVGAPNAALGSRGWVADVANTPPADRSESPGFGYDPAATFARTSARLRPGFLAPQTAGRLADDLLDLPTAKTWGQLDSLDDHFLRHGADFGAKSGDDYASQASQFFQRAQRQGLPTKIDARGVVRVYEPGSNTFGAYNPNGTTRTFFTPKRGADYWAEQPGSAPWGP